MIMQFAQEQTEHFYMEWPEGGQLSLKTANPSTWNIGLKSKNGWFEVEGEVPVDDDTVLTAAQLLQLVAQSPQKGFIRLGENEFKAISDRLRKQLARLESLTTSQRGHLHISELHASLLGSALSGEISIRHDEKIEHLQEKIKQSMELKPKTPRLLKADLRDYQQDGYQWMTRMTDWGAGVCLDRHWWPHRPRWCSTGGASWSGSPPRSMSSCSTRVATARPPSARQERAT